MFSALLLSQHRAVRLPCSEPDWEEQHLQQQRQGLKKAPNVKKEKGEILPDVCHSLMHATWLGCRLGDTHTHTRNTHTHRKRVSSACLPACLPPPRHQAPPRLSYSGERWEKKKNERISMRREKKKKKEAASQSPTVCDNHKCCQIRIGF